jgi:hypothetical protein
MYDEMYAGRMFNIVGEVQDCSVGRQASLKSRPFGYAIAPISTGGIPLYQKYH